MSLVGGIILLEKSLSIPIGKSRIGQSGETYNEHDHMPGVASALDKAEELGIARAPRKGWNRDRAQCSPCGWPAMAVDEEGGRGQKRRGL